MAQKKPINSSYFQQRTLRGSKISEFSIIDKFKYGYRNREDQTNLPAGVLVSGSKNVLTNVSERIQCRKGYVLDGPVSTIITPITSSYTYLNHLGVENNLRSYSETPTTGKLEYRYVNSTGAVTWRTLMSSLTSTAFNYSTFQDLAAPSGSGEAQTVLLMVNGSTSIYEWNGAITTASATGGSIGAYTLTKTGSTWATSGFYQVNSPRAVTINGTSYSYTGGETTNTLTGLTVNPASDFAIDPVVHQTPITTTAPTGLALTHYNLIANLRNQIYIGSLTNPQIFISKVNNYKDYTFTSPTRVVGEGAIGLLNGCPTAMIPLEESINISAGKNQWYTINWTLSSDLTKESISTKRLKTTANQAAQSQAMTSAMKNDVIFISFEPTLDRLGRVESILGSTQTTNISDSIKLDFDIYDFTDASIFYNKYFIYVSIPKNGTVLIYNIVKSYWEAPQTIPVSRFYTVDGVLYGHSYYTPESYKLFEGRADRVDPTTNPLGNPIDCKVVFSYINYSSPFNSKNFNKFYVEGYISSNTTLTLGIKYDIDGCASDTSHQIAGNDPAYVCLPTDNSSLGKSSLGKNPLGGNLNTVGTLPPKFRIIKTFPKYDFFEVQYSFESVAINSNWEVLRFGPSLEYSPTIATDITI